LVEEAAFFEIDEGYEAFALVDEVAVFSFVLFLDFEAGDEVFPVFVDEFVLVLGDGEHAGEGGRG
jgi:hypothetical protein